jgi:hypothetical protein
MIFTNIKLATYYGFISVSVGSSPLSTKAAFLLRQLIMIHYRAYKMESTHHVGGICHMTAESRFSRCSH